MEIKRSSQIIIMDDNNNVYLEKNKKFKCISFFWWHIEKWELPFETAIREIKEELWVNISQLNLEFIERETEELNHWKFTSYLYLLNINDKIISEILFNSNLVIASLEYLDVINFDTMIDENNFKRKIFDAIKINENEKNRV